MYGDLVGTDGEGYLGVALPTSSMSMYLRDGSAETNVHAATLR